MAPEWSNPAPLRVPQRLRPHVREIYGYAASGMVPGVHRGLPSSMLTVVLPIGEPLQTSPTWQAWRDGEVDSTHLVLGGLHTTSALVLQPRAWAGVQLSVSPLGARSLFGAPASALPTGQWDARDLIGPVVDETAERLTAAPDWPSRYREVVRFLDRLLGRNAEQGQVRPEVGRAWDVVLQRRGAVGTAELAREVGLSARRLTTLFGSELGVTPKLASRLARFEQARLAVAAAAVVRGPDGGSLDLSRIAVDLGYYDHAHLVRDFGDFAGLSPTAWVAEEFRNVQAGVELRAAASPT